MSKTNIVSVRFDDEALKKIEELIDHYECIFYENGIDYSNINNRSTILNVALDRMYREIIKKEDL